MTKILFLAIQLLLAACFWINYILCIPINISFAFIIKAVDEYQYFKKNERFANEYVDDFIEKILENEVVPDLLIETLNEMTFDNNNHGNARLPSDRYEKSTRGIRYLPDHINYDGRK